QAYEDAFRGGVRVALGDVAGDGGRDLIIAPGSGGGPRVKILDGETGDPVADFFGYEPAVTGGRCGAGGGVSAGGRGEQSTGEGGRTGSRGRASAAGRGCVYWTGRPSVGPCSRTSSPTRTASAAG